jgi:hypothetical protein
MPKHKIKKIKKTAPEHSTRAVPIRLVVPRDDSPESAATREALFETYRQVSDAVGLWQRRLLCMRQDDVYWRDDKHADPKIIPAADWRAELTKLTGITDPVALDDLHVLYRIIIGSYVELKGGKKNAALTFLRPLIDKGSRGGQVRFEDLRAFEWYLLAREQSKKRGESSRRRKLVAQINSDPSVLHPAHAPAAWIGRHQKETGVSLSRATWPDLLFEMLQKKRDELAGDHSVTGRLASAGVLPLFAPTLPGRLKTWEVCVFGMAAEQLLSWESQRHRMASDREELRQKIDKLNAEPPDPNALALLRAHEASIKWQIGTRATRGWSKIRAWLRDNPLATNAQQVAHVKKMQHLYPDSYGSGALLQWLALQPLLVACDSPEPVRWLAVMNEAVRKLARMEAEPLPTFTPSVGKGIELDCPARSNLPNYRLELDGGKLSVVIPTTTGAGPVELLVAKTRQLEDLKLSVDQKRQTALVTVQDRLGQSADELAGGRLLVKGGRAHLVVTTRRPVDQPTLRQRVDAAWYLEQPADARVKRVPPRLVRPGLLVLAVNEGLRHALGCTVFRLEALNSVPPEDRWGEVEGLAIVHERSFVLNLPGDVAGNAEWARRNEARRQLREVKGKIGIVRNVMRYYRARTQAERADIHEWLAKRAVGLPAPSSAPQAAWEATVGSFFRAVEHDAVVAIGQLRRTSHHDERHPNRRLGGESYWMIEYLEDLRRIYLSWADHERPGKARRTRTFDERGTVAKRLLEHINKLRRTRVQKTADLIVQAGRGCVYRGGRWERVYDPVDIVVFDDLSKYRFDRELTPAENTRLMEWSHRSVRDAVVQQTAEAGLAWAETPTLYASQFHPRSGAPGIRCRPVKAADVAGLERGGSWLDRYIEREGLTPAQVAAIREGDLIPVDGGEMLVTLDAQGELVVVHSDIAAAQNNGLRFLTGGGTARAWDEHKRRVTFVDPSGVFFPLDVETPSNEYWKEVRSRIVEVLGEIRGKRDWGANPVSSQREERRVRTYR